MVVLSWIDALLDWAKLLGYEWYLWLKWLANQVLSVLLVILAILWLSVFLYGGFYYTYMPSVSHVRDVHLQFRTDCEFDKKLCSFPSANESLSRKGENEVTLMRGQPYVVLFAMDMPESYVNQQLGMFMVNISFYAKNWKSIKSSSRTALLKYKSPLYQTIETWSFLPYLLFGYREQKQDVCVELFNNYQEDPYSPTIGFYVEVQSKRIEIYRSSLIIHARFSGLRYLLFTYPLTSAVFGVGTNMFFLMIMVLSSWQRLNPKDKSPVVPARILSLEERKNRVKARMEREMLARQSQDTPGLPVDVGPSTSATSIDTSLTADSLMTEAIPDTEQTMRGENVIDSTHMEDFEEVFHTSPDSTDDSLSEGIRHRSNVPSS